MQSKKSKKREKSKEDEEMEPPVKKIHIKVSEVARCSSLLTNQHILRRHKYLFTLI